MDRFLDRVAASVGESSRMLKSLAEVLDELGLAEWASVCRQQARRHDEIVVEIHEPTPVAGPLPTAKRPSGEYRKPE